MPGDATSWPATRFVLTSRTVWRTLRSGAARCCVSTMRKWLRWLDASFRTHRSVAVGARLGAERPDSSVAGRIRAAASVDESGRLADGLAMSGRLATVQGFGSATFFAVRWYPRILSCVAPNSLPTCEVERGPGLREWLRSVSVHPRYIHTARPSRPSTTWRGSTNARLHRLQLRHDPRQPNPVRAGY